ncbi:MAG TPA: hypothetical protein VJK48_01450 [Chlamydiales bacterium]|nr:hypothetical protein [Chlamydiales bacterium]
MIFLELNEFNDDLLREAARLFSLKNIQKLITLHRTQTFTEDTYESDFLEPWVQWVSVHTGQPSSSHQIKHLGDIPHLQKTPQLWERLSEMNITSGIWGAMNASRNGAKHCKFFLPDPWTASETGYPDELQALLDPLRYLAKNYLNPTQLNRWKTAKGLLNLFASKNLLWKISKEIPALARNALRFRGEHFPFISWLDSVSTQLFLNYRQEHNPTFSLIFLNSLAHLQHHHWKNPSIADNERLKIGFQYLDRILGALFASLKPGEPFLVTNALSQKNTTSEKPWILYRQKDPRNFLEAVSIQRARVEQHMTHDAHLFFESASDCKRAKQLLEQAQILESQLFLVESYPQDDRKLFYRICFTDKVTEDSTFTLGNRAFRFFDLFTPIVQRTGKHIPEGTVYSTISSLPTSMKNHELFELILRTIVENPSLCS